MKFQAARCGCCRCDRGPVALRFGGGAAAVEFRVGRKPERAGPSVIPSFPLCVPSPLCGVLKNRPHSRRVPPAEQRRDRKGRRAGRNRKQFPKRKKSVPLLRSLCSFAAKKIPTLTATAPPLRASPPAARVRRKTKSPRSSPPDPTGQTSVPAARFASPHPP